MANHILGLLEKRAKLIADGRQMVEDASGRGEVLEGEEVYRMMSEHTGLPVERLKGPGRPVPEVV